MTPLLLWTLLTLPNPFGAMLLDNGRGLDTSQQGADSPAQESRTPDVVLGSKEERAATAAGHYANNRPLEAALGFEGLWRDYPGEFRFLFNAAASRHAAGHHAHAVAYTEEYLERGKPRGEAKFEADAQLREARAGVVPVKVAVSVAPGGPGAVTLVAQHIARDSGDVRPELLFPAPLAGMQSDRTVELDPGAWMIRAQGDGYIAAEQRVEVKRDGLGPVTLRLELAPADGPATAGLHGAVSPALEKRMELGFAISGGVVAAVGIGVIAYGGYKGGKVNGDVCDVLTTCIGDLAHAVNARGNGGMLLGGGVGLLAGGLTWVVKDPVKRRKVWIAEAAIGGVGLVGGFIALFLVPDSFNAESKTLGWSDFYNKHHNSTGQALSNVSFGLGVGLLTSSISGLVVQRTQRGKNLRVSALVGPGQSGLALSGRF